MNRIGKILFVFILLNSCNVSYYGNDSYNNLLSNNKDIKIIAKIQTDCIVRDTYNTIVFSISNNTQENYWISTIGLMYYLNIIDSTGNSPSWIKSLHDRYYNNPDFILVKSNDTVSIEFPTNVFMRFQFDKNKEYIYQPGYKWHKKLRKRKTEYKTLTGVHYIKPFKFRICE